MRALDFCNLLPFAKYIRVRIRHRLKPRITFYNVIFDYLTSYTFFPSFSSKLLDKFLFIFSKLVILLQGDVCDSALMAFTYTKFPVHKIVSKTAQYFLSLKQDNSTTCTFPFCYLFAHFTNIVDISAVHSRIVFLQKYRQLDREGADHREDITHGLSEVKTKKPHQQMIQPEICEIRQSINQSKSNQSSDPSKVFDIRPALNLNQSITQIVKQ